MVHTIGLIPITGAASSKSALACIMHDVQGREKQTAGVKTVMAQLQSCRENGSCERGEGK